MKLSCPIYSSRLNDCSPNCVAPKQSRALFIVFEKQEQKNLLLKENIRHRLAYAQAKHPRSMIIRANVMSAVPVSHGMTVTSDKSTFMAIDLDKKTFREHKGKLSQIELDKFVR